MWTGPSEPALETLDAIHDRLESPADRLLRSVEPWSSYFALPIFALANAGVALSAGVFDGRERLTLAIVLGLVVGKPVGILAASWLAVRLRACHLPPDLSWTGVLVAGCLGGIGFTMSIFIATLAFPEPELLAAAKQGVLLASLVAGILGFVIGRAWIQRLRASEASARETAPKPMPLARQKTGEGA